MGGTGVLDADGVAMGSSRRGLATLGAAIALFLAGCGGGAGPAPGGAGPAPEGEPRSIARCDGLEPLRAPDSAYRDDPVYVGNEQPTAQVRAWAREQDGFESLWLDRGRNGWVTVAFAGDVAARQTEIDERFPGDGVVAVQVERTTAELEALADEVAAATGDAGVGVSVDPVHGVVTADVGFLTAERLALLEHFAADPVCAQGAPAAQFVAPGPQRAAGAGWRLLGEDLTGESYRTGVATTPDQYAVLWAQAGLPGSPPAVDLTSEIVIWFGAVYGSSCPIRLDDVVVTDGVVHADIVAPASTGACTDDANPHAFVVAVERTALPAGPFVVQLGAGPPPPGAPLERTVVDVDLSVLGSTGAGHEIGPDRDFPATEGNPPARSGGWVEVGLPVHFLLPVDATCGIERLGELNGVLWITDQGRQVPATWHSLVADGALTVEATITDLPARLTATAGGTTVPYRPQRSTDPPTCGRDAGDIGPVGEQTAGGTVEE